ncbi:ribbon-helix-helix protein, CopG family [Chloroflexota bacterium]
MPKYDWKRTIINLTPEQYEALRQLAQKERTQVTQLIRRAVQEWLNRQETPREKKR